MTKAEASRLRAGDKVFVKYGTNGKQLAVLFGAMTTGGRVPLRKFRANSRRWTNRMTVAPSEIIGRA